MIYLVTNADTEILALRSIAEGLPPGFPAVRALHAATLAEAPSLEGAQVVLVRLLGGRRAWERPFDRTRQECVARAIPLLAFGGEAVPDAELAALSTADASVVSKAFEYLVQGGLENLEHLLRFVSDSVLGTAFGFSSPAAVPPFGIWGDPDLVPGRPTVGVIFYRAHLISGNTQFVSDLCAAIEREGANALPAFCYSLRADEEGRVPVADLLASRGVDCLITTVLAAGSVSDGGEGWEAEALASLGVPVVQAITSTSSSAAWSESAAGLSPLDAAMAVAIPELDGRVISVPFSFKEVVDDGEDLGSPVVAYRTVADRVRRVAGTAARLAALRATPAEERRVAIVLSAYPTKRSRIGNAVGLDTPRSVVELLHQLDAAGYRVDRIPGSGDELMSELADGLAYEPGGPRPRTDAIAGSWMAGAYESWFGGLPEALRAAVTSAWGRPPGSVGVMASRSGNGTELAFCGIDLGGVLIAVQPPRGFGENPVAVYHSPDLPPTHHYLAFYRWLEDGWGASAVVHVGKHGTLEWLPGKGLGLSSACAPDAALGSLPLVYPFIVNDPGEGTQAKRRAHAVVVDHLVPPMTRAGTYDELAELEGLLDTHAQVAALDPSKLPAVRRKVWELLVRAEIHRDMGLEERRFHGGFEDDALDKLLPSVDGYLCELKDAQIRGGLHVLGHRPSDTAELDLVLSITRVAQGGVPSLRSLVAGELGIALDQAGRKELDRVEAACRERMAALQASGWLAPAASDPVSEWVCQKLVPALRRTPDELSSVLGFLDGGHVPSGPSGAPTRGMANALPTGRNFYSLDPRAVPSQLAWDVGRALAEAVVERHLGEEGRYPRTVGLVVWGTSAMRTAGDDVAEALALMGVAPRWAEESGRVEGLEVIGLEELGRPRIDVTVRVSGFFRDAFPHVIKLLDEAAELACDLDESPEVNFVKANGATDPRIFGPKPGAYGSGILALLESGDWEGDEDLAAVYLAWSGWSYARGAMGRASPDAMRRRFASIDAAVKNQDNREHDIFDSDDYLQDHGGMVAVIRSLSSGASPKAWFGDSSDPANPRLRSLGEEAARVVRTRVVNPKWIGAMQEHGYKGAFEMAATVDYLFGYDATAHVVEDWMYERVTQAYVADPSVRKFFERSNPWALHAIAERLLEAGERGMWDASEEATAALRSALLEAEGWVEGRDA